MKPFRLLAATVYPTSVAGTRLRAEQYRPYLQEVDIQLQLWTFISDRKVRLWFNGTHFQRLGVIAIGLVRIPMLLWRVHRADAILVLREILPFGPPILEWIVSRRRPLIWDVDDAVWRDHPSLFLVRLPNWIRRTGQKFDRTCGMAAQVWAGSELLAEWCRFRCDDVRVIPTVVNVPLNRPKRQLRPLLGWIGSPSTAEFLGQVLPAIVEVGPDLNLIVVGGEVASVAGLRIAQIPWSPEAEEKTLADIAIGLYPVDEGHPLADGKAGFKAILYMSRGIPCVITPTVTNAGIVRHEVEGLHARSYDEWTAAVRRFLSEPQLWERCGEASHQRALDTFSLARWGPKVASFVEELKPIAARKQNMGRGGVDR